MILQLELIDSNLPLPKYQTEGAAGFDLYLREKTNLDPRERGFFPANIKVAIPKGYFIAIKSRSSSFKLGINIFAGTIDCDFHKEIHIGIENTTKEKICLEKGQRIAQALIQKVEQVPIILEKIKENNRGGFGSTGAK